jgi:branched-chain amino acid transport system permease protein
MDVPSWLAGSIELIPGVPYPSYRIAVIAVGIMVGVLLYLLFTRTRIGMQIRAGASNREMAGALGVNIRSSTPWFSAWERSWPGLAGVMAGPILAVEAGMGESILILTFVVIVIGGIGSIRGALVGALLVGLVDTLGRAFSAGRAAAVSFAGICRRRAASLASMSVYLLMACWFKGLLSLRQMSPADPRPCRYAIPHKFARP